jgi:hypothetical protein
MEIRLGGGDGRDGGDGERGERRILVVVVVPPLAVRPDFARAVNDPAVPERRGSVLLYYEYLLCFGCKKLTGRRVFTDDPPSA